MKVVFARAAERGLEDIGDYIAGENPSRAETFVEELRVAALSIGRLVLRTGLAGGGAPRKDSYQAPLTHSSWVNIKGAWYQTHSRWSRTMSVSGYGGEFAEIISFSIAFAPSGFGF